MSADLADGGYYDVFNYYPPGTLSTYWPVGNRFRGLFKILIWRLQQVRFYISVRALETGTIVSPEFF